MLGTEQQKRLRKALQAARSKEPDQDVRLVQTLGGVAFSRKRDREPPDNGPIWYPLEAPDPRPLHEQITGLRLW